MTPRQLDCCTPVELMLMLRAAETRDDRGWRMVAQLAVWMLAPWSKKRLTADKLLRRRPPAPPLIPGDMPRPADLLLKD